MDLAAIERSFSDAVCAELQLRKEGVNRFRVINPFMYGDGDHLSIVLRHEGDRWLLSDEASTFMHLSYSLDDRALEAESRKRVIASALSFFGVEDDDGELKVEIGDDDFGSALYSLVQAMLRISDVTFLSRERVQSTFRQDLKDFLSEITEDSDRTFNWAHPAKDPERLYTADCHINGSGRVPAVVFGLVGEASVRDATIALQRYETWDYPVYSVGIFEHFDDIGAKPLRRFLDVLDKPFTSLDDNKVMIEKKIISRPLAR